MPSAEQQQQQQETHPEQQFFNKLGFFTDSFLLDVRASSEHPFKSAAACGQSNSPHICFGLLPYANEGETFSTSPSHSQISYHFRLPGSGQFRRTGKGKKCAAVVADLCSF